MKARSFIFIIIFSALNAQSEGFLSNKCFYKSPRSDINAGRGLTLAAGQS